MKFKKTCDLTASEMPTNMKTMDIESAIDGDIHGNQRKKTFQ